MYDNLCSVEFKLVLRIFLFASNNNTFPFHNEALVTQKFRPLLRVFVDVER